MKKKKEKHEQTQIKKQGKDMTFATSETSASEASQIVWQDRELLYAASETSASETLRTIIALTIV